MTALFVLREIKDFTFQRIWIVVYSSFSTASPAPEMITMKKKIGRKPPRKEHDIVAPSVRKMVGLTRKSKEKTAENVSLTAARIAREGKREATSSIRRRVVD